MIVLMYSDLSLLSIIFASQRLCERQFRFRACAATLVARGWRTGQDFDSLPQEIFSIAPSGRPHSPNCLDRSS